MAFTPLDPNVLKVGDPITSDVLNLIRTDLDDHEARINSLATSGGTVFIFNGDISLIGFNLSDPVVFYYKARQDFSINDFRVQLFTKQGISSGNLVIDLQKASNTNDANFATILTTQINFNFATDLDYSEKSALINASLNDISTGQVLRVKLLNIPNGYYGKILLSIGGQ